MRAVEFMVALQKMLFGVVGDSVRSDGVHGLQDDDGLGDGANTLGRDAIEGAGGGRLAGTAPGGHPLDHIAGARVATPVRAGLFRSVELQSKVVVQKARSFACRSPSPRTPSLVLVDAAAADSAAADWVLIHLSASVSACSAASNARSRLRVLLAMRSCMVLSRVPLVPSRVRASKKIRATMRAAPRSDSAKVRRVFTADGSQGEGGGEGLGQGRAGVGDLDVGAGRSA